MKAKLWLKIGDGEEFELSQKIPGVEFLSETETPALTNSYQEFSGLDGSSFNFSSIGKNTLNVKLIMHYGTYYQYKSLRYDLQSLFIRKEPIQIHTDSEYPFVKVVRPVGFEIEPFSDGSHDSVITIPFENPSGYKFSRNKSNKQDDLWDAFPLGWDIPEFAPGSFEFKDTQFRVYNPSDLEIDPYYQKHDLKLLLKYTGDSVGLYNSTNGSQWTLNKKSTGNDQVLVDGINTYFNNNQVNADTDFGNLVLAKGWNEISAIGATDIDVIFSFPFIYV